MPTTKSAIVAIKLALVFMLIIASGLTDPALTARAAGSVIRVTPNGEYALPCGEIWANPCSLQFALNTVAESTDQIWVAAGTYKPGVSGDRNASFILKDGVAVYGGFIGNEIDVSQRDWRVNVVILSGDLNDNNLDDFDSYHVVQGADNAILDGVTIIGGNANGAYPNYYGGGMFNNQTSPTVTNVTISGNYAVYGGGMYNLMGNPFLIDSIFSNNSAQIAGGGMYNLSNTPTLTGLIFKGNSATIGGGLSNNSSSPVLNKVIFTDNFAHVDGGGMNNNNSSPVLTNVTFNENYAEFGGGGIVNYMSNPLLTNITFRGNLAIQAHGGGIYNDRSNLVVRNSIFWGDNNSEIYNENSTTDVSYSVVQGGYPGVGNLDSDPLLAPLGDYGGGMETVALLPGSLAIDAASSYCPDVDQRGVTRLSHACDIGAFESRGFTITKIGGDNQNTGINTAFTQPLSVLVSAVYPVEPVNGGKVTFTVPATGPAAFLEGNPAVITEGTAQVNAEANDIPGAFTVNISTMGANSVNFSLTNGLNFFLPYVCKTNP
jgi:hypothetical protein